MCIPMSAYRIKPNILGFLLLLGYLSFGEMSVMYAQSIPISSQNEEIFRVAPVKLDGNDLFLVRGISSFPAEKRAEGISQRIIQVARDEAILPESISVQHNLDYSSVMAGEIEIVRIYEADAKLEGVARNTLADTIDRNISSSISKYRHDRSRPVILNSLLYSGFAIVIFIVSFFALLWIFRLLKRFIQRRIQKKIASVETISFNLIKSNHLWQAVHVLMNTFRAIVLTYLTVVFLDYVFSLFPWTNALSKYILRLIVDPVKELEAAFIHYIPKLIFLIIIYFIIRYLLQLIKLFFSGIQQGAITIKDFRPEWAISTYKIVRVFVLALALVIAYPYIPGSDSVAFKGISVFIGVIFSLGSSSFIGNLIAGYSMIYRGAFKIGDRIEVDGQIGFVEEQKLLVTRLRSHKNEEIVLPNSVLLNSKIINYSSNSNGNGVVVHVTIGIGYETPWRQVDAMLKLAVKRTNGLLKDPTPYVMKKSLGDYAVLYEVNAYCKDIPRINTVYSELNQNILDVFNENDVQIMTPSYVDDPEIPKVVPKDQWNKPLAKEE